MRKTKSHDALPMPATQALRRLGEAIATARKLRGITMQLMAERAMISRGTLSRVEKGDAGVAFGTYASVLFVLGLAETIGDMLRGDAVTEAQLGLRIPKRVRARRSGMELAGVGA